MNVSGRNGRPRPTRLNTFEILRLILEAIDHGQIPAGPTGTPSFRTIWSDMSGPIERGRWAYAWNFIRDEEMIFIDNNDTTVPAWRLTLDGRILLRELRLGAFSSLAPLGHAGRHDLRSPGADNRFMPS